MESVKILNKPKTVKLMKAEVMTEHYFISGDQTTPVHREDEDDE